MVESIETRADGATRRSKGARDGQQLKALSDDQLGQVVEQFVDARQFAQAHLGGDLPTGSAAHIDGMGCEQQLLAARAWQLERHLACPGLASFGHKDRFAGMGGIDQL